MADLKDGEVSVGVKSPEKIDDVVYGLPIPAVQAIWSSWAPPDLEIEYPIFSPMMSNKTVWKCTGKGLS